MTLPIKKRGDMSEVINSGEKRIVIKIGDITLEDTDAIVNAANSSLMGGGGVDGAIHRAGGPEILEECKKITAEIGKLPAGQAVITTGGRLKAKFVIHTVGPIWHGGMDREEELLRSCYRESLLLAEKYGLKSIAFPSISTGAYRYPIDRASPVALGSVRDTIQSLKIEEVRFVLFSENDYRIYIENSRKIFS